MKPKVGVFRNNDQTFIAWSYDKLIPGCIGFAVYRKRNNESTDAAEPLLNKVGFAGQKHQPNEQRPSTEWPIQRFTWTDYTVDDNDTVSYKIIPMILENNNPVKDESNASDWTEPAKIETGSTYKAFYNRGVISSQFLSRMKDAVKDGNKKLSVKKIIEGKDSFIRDFLGGYLAKELFSLLDMVINDKSYSIYAALYELSQDDLIDKLCKIGKRANVILANGAFKKKGEDKNSKSRKKIKAAKVNVSNRIVPVNHFAHNKFLVLCKNDNPVKVWTGSTNWSPGGLFAQANNGILIDDSKLADIYLKEWEQIKKAKNDYPADYIKYNTKENVSGDTTVFFNALKDEIDLDYVRTMMDKAESGILFLMFNPGPKGTLYNKIQEVQKAKPDLYIHGILNQDPGGKKNPLVFFHRGKIQSTDWNTILPKKIDIEQSYWLKETSAGLVTIHSKVMVIDPFSKNAVAITGSNNFGPKASSKNDDNLVIIRDKKTVEEYAVNIMSLYDHYRWRYSQYNKKTKFQGTVEDVKWMESYSTPEHLRELTFWLGE